MTPKKAATVKLAFAAVIPIAAWLAVIQLVIVLVESLGKILTILEHLLQRT